MNALTVKVNETDISVKEYHGKRVVTFKDIGACHNRCSTVQTALNRLSGF